MILFFDSIFIKLLEHKFREIGSKNLNVFNLEIWRLNVRAVMKVSLRWLRRGTFGSEAYARITREIVFKQKRSISIEGTSRPLILAGGGYLRRGKTKAPGMRRGLWKAAVRGRINKRRALIAFAQQYANALICMLILISHTIHEMLRDYRPHKCRVNIVEGQARTEC